jgi:hypothetical protein
MTEIGETIRCGDRSLSGWSRSRRTPNRAQLEALRQLTERRNTMTTRSVVLLAALLVALPASAQDQFEEATRATAAACVEFLTQERLPACVLALQRQVLQLQSIVQDRGQRIAALEEAVRVLSDNQREMAALGHCHDWQEGCDVLLQNR